MRSALFVGIAAEHLSRSIQRRLQIAQLPAHLLLCWGCCPLQVLPFIRPARRELVSHEDPCSLALSPSMQTCQLSG